ncbi:tegument protein UL43 [Panine betaherpesvirus 2]|uniref:Tegument protein UL43 n=1 Tax=Panine betaherpesvirus 2 TaxID=188763 RepID=Q8QS46_9BETA|nr:tegument protein UL43 [Panine betaherpesvirus 2]AAM00692.1 tegument protein UL43 [Panine betaherpesvirus 2]QXV67797.1 tegument protein UL43 [Panine betaherpesvirus 2]
MESSQKPRDRVPCITNMPGGGRSGSNVRRRPACIGDIRRRSSSLSQVSFEAAPGELERRDSGTSTRSGQHHRPLRRRSSGLDVMKERSLEDALAAELVNETFRCSVAPDARKELQKLVRRVSGTVLHIGWPFNWYFTYCDLLRLDYFSHLNIKGLEKVFLCCDRFLLPVGTACQGEPGRAPLAIFIGEGGRVYCYAPSGDCVYLISRSGFHGFVSNGLRNFAPLREELGWTHFDSGGDLGWEFVVARDLMSLWRLCMKHEGSVFSWVDNRESMTTCVLNGGQTYESPHHPTWLKDTGSLNVLQIFTVKAVQVEPHRRLDISILVNECGLVFGVHPETNRAHFLARGLQTFFNVGFLRFNNNYCFGRDCFSHPESVLPAFRATSCPRDVFCRRLRKKRGLFGGSSSPRSLPPTLSSSPLLRR